MTPTISLPLWLDDKHTQIADGNSDEWVKLGTKDRVNFLQITTLFDSNLVFVCLGFWGVFGSQIGILLDLPVLLYVVWRKRFVDA
jgi:hypothetical protein